MRNNKKLKFTEGSAEGREFREMTLEEIDQIVATGQYTAREMYQTESYTRILETKSILKKLHLA